MRKLLTWGTPIVGTLFLTGVFNYFFPQLLPALLAWLAQPMPAWTLVLSTGAALALGYKLWNATSPDRKRKARAAARNSYKPGEAEQSILQVFAAASGEIANFHLQNDLQKIAEHFGVARLELTHGLESLKSIGWLEGQVTGYMPEVATLTLSREAIAYCKRMGWWVATADRAATPDP